MKIVVCIKQVPDTKGGVQFNPDGTLNRAAMLAIMNPDDKAGLEAALRLKDQYGAEVTVLTMGLPKAADVLREALAMGADKARHFCFQYMISVFELTLYDHAVAFYFDILCIRDYRDVQMFGNLRSNLCCITIDCLTSCDDQVIIEFTECCCDGA